MDYRKIRERYKNFKWKKIKKKGRIKAVYSLGDGMVYKRGVYTEVDMRGLSWFGKV